MPYAARFTQHGAAVGAGGSALGAGGAVADTTRGLLVHGTGEALLAHNAPLLRGHAGDIVGSHGVRETGADSACSAACC